MYKALEDTIQKEFTSLNNSSSQISKRVDHTSLTGRMMIWQILPSAWQARMAQSRQIESIKIKPQAPCLEYAAN